MSGIFHGGRGHGGGGISQAENDLLYDIHNPNHHANRDDWSHAHNPNNDDHLGEDNIGGGKN